MLISNVHLSIIVMNSLDTRFSRNVFEAVQKTCSTCFIGSKTTRLHLMVLNPNKTLLLNGMFNFKILMACSGQGKMFASACYQYLGFMVISDFFWQRNQTREENNWHRSVCRILPYRFVG